MIAIGMNGEALPREHGFPARMVVPGLYGFVSATKWITRMTLTTYAEQDAYWTERDWATDAPIKIVQPDRHPQAALHHRRRPHRHRRRRLGPAPAASSRSRCASTAAPGRRPRLGPERRRRLLAPVVPALGRRAGPAPRSPCRATDGDGDVQTAARATPFPDGSSGIQQIVVTVA